jgi:hypothetical protein
MRKRLNINKYLTYKTPQANTRLYLYDSNQCSAPKIAKKQQSRQIFDGKYNLFVSTTQNG